MMKLGGGDLEESSNVHGHQRLITLPVANLTIVITFFSIMLLFSSSVIILKFKVQSSFDVPRHRLSNFNGIVQYRFQSI